MASAQACVPTQEAWMLFEGKVRKYFLRRNIMMTFGLCRVPVKTEGVACVARVLLLLEIPLVAQERSDS